MLHQSPYSDLAGSLIDGLPLIVRMPCILLKVCLSRVCNLLYDHNQIMIRDHITVICDLHDSKNYTNFLSMHILSCYTLNHTGALYPVYTGL